MSTFLGSRGRVFHDRWMPDGPAHTVADQLPHATVRTFPGDLHDVLNEHDRDAVHDVVAEFLDHAVVTRRIAG